MSNKTSTPSGMLNTYLHEKHVPVEEHVAVSTKGNPGHCTSGRENRPKFAATNKEDQAVDDLDKYLRQKTDPHLLRIARKDQKRCNAGTGPKA